MTRLRRHAPASVPDSPYAVMRLAITLILVTIGTAGMYIIAVILPAVQDEFGVTRADASMPYTFMMLGFGLGGMLMGYLADRFGVFLPLLIGATGVGLGFCLAAATDNIWSFTLIHGVLIGLLGASTTFAPLVADTSLWFVLRRGIAVAVCASGNYLSGAIWPPIIQPMVYDMGWRQTYVIIGLFSFVCMAGLAVLMRRPPPLAASASPSEAATAPKLHPNRTPDRDQANVDGQSPAHAQALAQTQTRAQNPTQAQASTETSQTTQNRPFGLSPRVAQFWLCVAGISCCVAMAMPQVHIVAYCLDLGYGVARGAEMLSLMLGFGVLSRIISGIVCDRIGGLRTLLLGAALQAIALILFLPSDGLVSLYIVSALFGLFQGGLVPAYAIIVREHFSPAEAGARVGTVLMATLVGMALGGWMTGKIYDLAGSYQAAFINGIGWNLLTLIIVATLLRRVWPAR